MSFGGSRVHGTFEKPEERFWQVRHGSGFKEAKRHKQPIIIDKPMQTELSFWGKSNFGNLLLVSGNGCLASTSRYWTYYEPSRETPPEP